MQRRTVGLTLVGGLLALVGIAVACGPSTAWPPTVQSGQGGGGGGSSTPNEDSGTPSEDSGTSPGTDSGLPITAGETCTLAAEYECSIIKSVAAGTTATCNGTVGTACPTANLVGCCTASLGGNQVEACFYTGATAPGSTSATCTSGGGNWATTMD
jgi:hypothetical protein